MSGKGEETAPGAGHMLRAPQASFFSTHRRRSKTYSGEEFAQHFAELANKAMSTSESTTGMAKVHADHHHHHHSHIQEDDHPRDLPKMLHDRRNDYLFSNRRST